MFANMKLSFFRTVRNNLLFRTVLVQKMSFYRTSVGKYICVEFVNFNTIEMRSINLSNYIFRWIFQIIHFSSMLSQFINVICKISYFRRKSDILHNSWSFVFISTSWSIIFPANRSIKMNNFRSYWIIFHNTVVEKK